MTKRSKIVLNAMRELATNEDVILGHISNGFTVQNGEHKRVELPSTFSGTCGILSYLIEQGYVTKTSKADCYRLTHKGVHPYLVPWQTVKTFMLKNILTPIGVAIITSLIVNLLIA
jgi:hypothetical protein